MEKEVLILIHPQLQMVQFSHTKGGSKTFSAVKLVELVCVCVYVRVNVRVCVCVRRPFVKCRATCVPGGTAGRAEVAAGLCLASPVRLVGAAPAFGALGPG